jgi:hypothetical protein
LSSFGLVELSAVFAMLDDCAKGHTRSLGDHKWVIRYKGITFPSLPKGQHEKRDGEIKFGYVRRLVRALKIELECASRHFPALRAPDSAANGTA